jgi:hypothetical protein
VCSHLCMWECATVAALRLLVVYYSHGVAVCAGSGEVPATFLGDLVVETSGGDDASGPAPDLSPPSPKRPASPFRDAAVAWASVPSGVSSSASPAPTSVANRAAVSAAVWDLLSEAVSAVADSTSVAAAAGGAYVAHTPAVPAASAGSGGPSRERPRAARPPSAVDSVPLSSAAPEAKAVVALEAVSDLSLRGSQAAAATAASAASPDTGFIVRGNPDGAASAGDSGGLSGLSSLMSPLAIPCIGSPLGFGSPLSATRALSVGGASSLWSEPDSASEDGDRPSRRGAGPRKPTRPGRHYPPVNSARFLKPPSAQFPLHAAAWNGDMDGVQVGPQPLPSPPPPLPPPPCLDLSVRPLLLPSGSCGLCVCLCVSVCLCVFVCACGCLCCRGHRGFWLPGTRPLSRTSEAASPSTTRATAAVLTLWCLCAATAQI